MRRRGGLCVALVAFCGVACGGDDGPTAPTCDSGGVNAPPIIATQTDTVVSVGDTLFLTARASDVDQDTVRYSVTVELRALDWRTWTFPEARIDATSGRFWFAPGPLDAPSRRIHFVADDGRCGRDSTLFTVRVTSRGS
jgi:hypothetical protein